MIRYFFSKAELRNTARLDEHSTAVLVTRCGQSFIVTGPVFVAGADTALIKLPSRMRVVSPNGDAITPSTGRSFYISTSSCDPCHALIEMSDHR